MAETSKCPRMGSAPPVVGVVMIVVRRMVIAAQPGPNGLNGWSWSDLGSGGGFAHDAAIGDPSVWRAGVDPPAPRHKPKACRDAADRPSRAHDPAPSGRLSGPPRGLDGLFGAFRRESGGYCGDAGSAATGGQYI